MSTFEEERTAHMRKIALVTTKESTATEYAADDPERRTESLPGPTYRSPVIRAGSYSPMAGDGMVASRDTTSRR